MEVQDLRETARFIVNEPVTGTYGAAVITMIDISGQGAQIAHAQPLRLGGKGRLMFKIGGLTVTAQGLTIWSRFAKSAEAASMVYRSGVRIESDIEEFANAVQSLIDRGLAQPDTESLDRKRQRLLDRNADKTSKLVLKGSRPAEAAIPSDQVLLIQHARERLRLNPEEAMKWYNRAKFAAGTEISDAIPNREEVLAVWEYLERSVDVPTIVTVFELQRKF